MLPEHLVNKLTRWCLCFSYVRSMESWVPVLMASVKWKQWFQARADPIMKQPAVGLAELLPLHSNIKIFGSTPKFSLLRVL